MRILSNASSIECRQFWTSRRRKQTWKAENSPGDHRGWPMGVSGRLQCRSGHPPPRRAVLRLLLMRGRTLRIAPWDTCRRETRVACPMWNSCHLWWPEWLCAGRISRLRVVKAPAEPTPGEPASAFRADRNSRVSDGFHPLLWPMTQYACIRPNDHRGECAPPQDRGIRW